MKFFTILLFQDSMNTLFHGESVAEYGTLAQIKGLFDHRNCKKKVIENYQHVVDLIKVTFVGL